ncbi:MAG TPA: TerC family protein [Pseudomonadales bacterium]|jgi:predicted tellurium resistance membrane protein TerC|nr:TerC family protein [Pseudomonadales bacterium]
MEFLTDPEVWLAFLTLTVLEIVLGIDNIIFISVLTGRLPEAERARGRFLGLALAMLMRIVLLLSLTWVMKLTDDLFTVFEQAISGRDLILILGGAFLIGKSTQEVHTSLEGMAEGHDDAGTATFGSVLLQIGLIDIVFSLDSVITAVGLAKHVEVMIAAIVISVLIMMMAAGSISRFVEDHPTIKMLALSFLLLIGVTLIAEGLDVHVPRGYIYFAMAFSFGVEVLNIRVRKRRTAPIRLRHQIVDGSADPPSSRK